MKRLFMAVLAALCLPLYAQTAEHMTHGGPVIVVGPTMPVVVMSTMPERANSMRAGLRVRPVRVDLSTEQPIQLADHGAARFTCIFSHANLDDPIVFPGQKSRTHPHAFYGNVGTDYRTTADNIITGIGSTCPGGTANESAYWVPTYVHKSTGAMYVPKSALIYYKDGTDGIRPESITVPPDRLRILAGNPKNDQPSGVFKFECIKGKEIGTRPPGKYGGINYAYMPNCPVGSELWMTVKFPQCWNGVDLDSPDHKSHMSYVVNKACPATHPVPIPQIEIVTHLDVTEEGLTTQLACSSDMYAPNEPGTQNNGCHSAHADWFEGHMAEIKATWVRECINARRDCRNNLLGDGRTLY